MDLDKLGDPAPAMEMTTKEAAAYLSGPVGYALGPKTMYALKDMGFGPAVEKRGRRLVYRRSALDAFLIENGTDPQVWIESHWRRMAEKLRTFSSQNPEFDFAELADVVDEPPADGWDPDLAKQRIDPPAQPGKIDG